MNDVKIARITGVFGIACVALTFRQFPLWLVGSAPSIYDGCGFAQHLFDIKNVAFTRILMDQIVANFPPMIWFLAASVILIRRHDFDSRVIVRVA